MGRVMCTPASSLKLQKSGFEAAGGQTRRCSDVMRTMGANGSWIVHWTGVVEGRMCSAREP